MNKFFVIFTIILLSFFKCDLNLYAQKISFPVFSNNIQSYSVSDDGKYTAIIDNSNTVFKIDNKTGATVFSKKIDNSVGTILQQKLSFYGNYLVLISTYSEESINVYFIDLTQNDNSLDFSSGLNQFYLCEYYSYEEMRLKIESNSNEDFIFKSMYSSQFFYFYLRYQNYEGEFYPVLNLSDIDQYGESFYDYTLKNFKKSYTSFYDVSDNEKYAIVITDYLSNKNKPSTATSDISIGLWNLEIKKSSENFKRLFFIHQEYEFDDDIKEFYLGEEGEYIYNMKYHEGENAIYGLANFATILDWIVKDYQIENEGEIFDENLYQKIKNYYLTIDNFIVIPFIYHINDNKFTTIFNNEEFNWMENSIPFDKLPNHNYSSIYLGFTKDLKYFYNITFNEEKNVIEAHLLDIKKQEMVSRTTNLPVHFSKYEITNDDKIIMHIYKDFSKEVEFVIFDIKTLSIVNELLIDDTNVKTPLCDGFILPNEKGNNFLFFDDEKLIKFNLNELPFYQYANSFDEELNQEIKQVYNQENFINNCYHLLNGNIDFRNYGNWMGAYEEDFRVNNYYRFHHYYADYLIDYGDNNILYYMDEGFPVLFNDSIHNTEEEKFYKNTYYNLFYKIENYEYHRLTNKLFIVNGKTIEKYNPETNKVEYVYIKHKENIKSFDVLHNDSLMISMSEDGEINFWNINSNQHLASLYFFDKGKSWIYILPNNYYFGTPDAIQRLSFVHENKVFPMEYFELKYNRPDLVLKALGSQNQQIIQAYHQAYLKRLKKLGIQEEMLRLDFDIPFAQITNKDLIPLQIDEDKIDINLNIYDLRYPLDRINIWVNDVAIYGTNGISLRDLNVKSYQTEVSVPLALGTNKVQVSVLNQAGAESYKESFTVESSKGKKQPDLYIITLGVSEYQDSRYNLKYAAKDAQDMVQVFENSKMYGKVFTKTLVNQEVNLENITELKDFLEKADINDQVIVFVAGHGVLDANFDYYFASYDMDFSNPSQRGIPYEKIEGLLNGIKPLKKLLIMDTCHSGEVEKDEIAMVDSDPTEENGDIVFRNVGVGYENKENQLGLKNTSELMKSLFTDLRKGTGATVISSSGGVEFAMESDQWHNGLFTYCLIYGIQSQSADLNRDGIITVSELQSYVQTQVQILSKGKQTPTSRIVNQSLDYRVW